MHSDAFDVIPFEVHNSCCKILLSLMSSTISKDIKGDWKKLGAGSFGNVYKGQPPQTLDNPLFTLHTATYLGIDVAIKEVLPSTDYDVAKYFEREWRLMKLASM